ncbi:MAG: magnesium transporter [Phycisphaerales bacterium]|nr:MAG: magnesium transporter [Phycisphaerales bacterium]
MGDPLIGIVERYVKNDAADAARALEALEGGEAAQVLEALPPATAAQIIPHLQISYAAALLKDMRPGDFKTIVRSMDAARAASLFMHLPEDSRERLLPQAPKKLKSEIRDLLVYPEDSVGRLMVRTYLSFHQKERVSDAIKKIRRLASRPYPASYGYVVDDEEHLVGVINARDLLLASDEALLESVINRNVFTLDCYMDRAEAAEELGKRRYFAAPVVDSENRILGIHQGGTTDSRGTGRRGRKHPTDVRRES